MRVCPRKKSKGKNVTIALTIGRVERCLFDRFVKEGKETLLFEPRSKAELVVVASENLGVLLASLTTRVESHQDGLVLQSSERPRTW